MKKVQNFLLILPIESGIIKVAQKHAPVCRNGRRGGLKIPCANNTCGFDPHHRHKKENFPSLSGGVFFLSAACERVEQHGPALQGERSALRAVAQCAGDPHHRHKTSPACLGEFSFLSAACERVEQHGPALQSERSALRAVAQCAGDPHHRHKKKLPQLVWGSFVFICGV